MIANFQKRHGERRRKKRGKTKRPMSIIFFQPLHKPHNIFLCFLGQRVPIGTQFSSQKLKGFTKELATERINLEDLCNKQLFIRSSE